MVECGIICGIIDSIIERVGIIIEGVGIIIKGIVVIEGVATFPDTKIRHLSFLATSRKAVWTM